MVDKIFTWNTRAMFQKHPHKLCHLPVLQNRRPTVSTTLQCHVIHRYILPQSSISVGCVIYSHSSGYRIIISSHGSLCPRIKSFFIAPIASCASLIVLTLLLCTSDLSHTWNISSSRLYMRIKLCSAQQAVIISCCLDYEKECISFRMGNLAFNMPKHRSITIHNDECL